MDRLTVDVLVNGCRWLVAMAMATVVKDDDDVDGVDDEWPSPRTVLRLPLTALTVQQIRHPRLNSTSP